MKNQMRKEWRRRLGRKQQKSLSRFLILLISLECCYGIGRQLTDPLIINSMIREEQSDRVEWVVPSPDDRIPETDVYGVFFDWKEGRLQFYHSKQSINAH